MQQADENTVNGVLVVDDDSMNLELLTRAVKDSGFQAHSFADSTEAWAFLCRSPHACDIALLDKMMPGMDGLELLQRIKCQQSLRDMPVIIQTGDVSAEEMRKGIDARAFYYLIKPFHPDVLLSVLQAAAREVVSRHEMQTGVLTALPSEFLQQAEFTARTPAEARELSAGIGTLFTKPAEVAGGLYEVILNGIEHGNLQIGFERKGELLMANDWDNEIARRLENPLYRARRVRIMIQRTKGGFQIVIRDEGDGFDVAAYYRGKSLTKQFTGPNGRGIARAMLALGCRIQYLHNGSEAHCHVPNP
jgi:two-component system cell cycle response regulator